MRKLIEHCPACSGDLIVTQQSCVQCGTSVVGHFQPTIFDRLNAADLAFVEAFVRNKGNIKEMERELGESYWSIRSRLNEVIEALGFQAKPDHDPQLDSRQQRQAILSQLQAGELSVAEATKLLSALR